MTDRDERAGRETSREEIGGRHARLDRYLPASAEPEEPRRGPPMNVPGASEGRLFELPDEKFWFMRLSLGARAASAFLIALALSSAITIPSMLWPGATLSYSPAAGFVLVVALVVFFAVLSLRHGQRVIEVRISAEGIGIVDSHGKESVQRWTDPQFGLTLMDRSKEARASRAAKRNVELWSNGANRGWVPLELASRITEEARSQGLSVVAREERFSRGNAEGILIPTTRIGRMESTPRFHSLQAD
jgi:hypothetical protein